MSAKVKPCVLVFLLLTLAIMVLIWNQNPHQIISLTWVQALVSLCLLISVIYLTWLITKLRSRNNYLFASLEKVQEIIALFDPKANRFVFINHALENILGYTAKEALSNNILLQILFNNQDRPFDDFRNLRTTLSGMTQARRKDGSPVYLEYVAIPVYRKGHISKIAISSWDISERVQMEQSLTASEEIYQALIEAREQAQAANMAKNQFLANMSHEIRTPMIGILGALDLLAESKLAKEQYENIEIIRECGEQLLGIINGILDMSKIELGLTELYPKACNLPELFSHLVNIVEPILKEKGLSIRLDISPDIPAVVRLDEAKLRQVLINVFWNAIKFTSQGYITFTATIEEMDGISQLSLAISDTGIGIPDYEMENIFTPFTQVDNSTSRQYGGMGLGLFISKKYMDIMQGSIYVESQQGSGSTFFIKVPLEVISYAELNENINPGYNDNYEDKLLTDFAPIRVLLVEDNDLNQKIVSQMLVNYGFEITVANDGLECLRLLQENHFDVILMDMQMPVMDGYEATRMIRQYEELQHIPVIAMTAHAMAGDREKCLVSGCTSYIAKPFKAEELAREIRKHFQGVSTNNPDPDLKSFINELLPEFMAQLEEMVDNLGLAFAQRDIEAIKSISHDIKGTAGMYGFRQISDGAAAIEAAAREGSFSRIKTCLDQLNHYYKQASVQVS